MSRASTLARVPSGAAVCHAPAGELLVDGDRVCCHLCGGWFLSVGAHLPSHGWTRREYLDAFGLPRSCPLEGPATHARRSAALVRRQGHERQIQRAQSGARARARSGALALAAARANRGRTPPLQTRRKAMATLAAVDLDRRAERTREAARVRLERVGHAAAVALGFVDLPAFAEARLTAGHSLADMSLELGFHKDWMCRQLPKLHPGVAALAHTNASARRDRMWQEPLQRLGFDGVGSFLRQRHTVEGRTVNAIARETGLGKTVVTAALAGHGIAHVPHSGKRRAAAAREQAVADALGTSDLAAWIDDRRRAGVTWQHLVAETGQCESWLRRRIGA